MKKVFIIILMLVYGVSSSGMTASLHYCCGKLDNISFSGRHSAGCAMGEKIKMTSCCDDQKISVKVNPDQQPVNKNLKVNNNIAAVPYLAPAIVNYPRQGRSTVKSLLHTPYLFPSVPIFIKNCIFRV